MKNKSLLFALLLLTMVVFSCGKEELVEPIPNTVAPDTLALDTVALDTVALDTEDYRDAWVGQFDVLVSSYGQMRYEPRTDTTYRALATINKYADFQMKIAFNSFGFPPGIRESGDFYLYGYVNPHIWISGSYSGNDRMHFKVVDDEMTYDWGYEIWGTRH